MPYVEIDRYSPLDNVETKRLFGETSSGGEMTRGEKRLGDESTSKDVYRFSFYHRTTIQLNQLH